MRRLIKVVSFVVLVALSVSLFSSCNLEINVNGIISDLESAVEDIMSVEDETTTSASQNVTVEGQFTAEDIPEYTGDAYVSINDSLPYFTDEEKTTDVFEIYSELDSLGRCGVAYANICKELMPTSSREDIGSVTPSGWMQKKYDFVDGGYLYNRCHLIGFQLAGENANPLNLITGTRYLNIEGMLPFENLVDDYVDETKNHVLYRVTPVFSGSELVCRGVLMEGFSVEDDGEGICFCVFAYNVQPGVIINYVNGSSTLDNSARIDTEITIVYVDFSKEYTV